MTLASVMYPLKNGSPKALSTADITDTDTQLYISDLSVLPAAPNLYTQELHLRFQQALSVLFMQEAEWLVNVDLLRQIK